MKLSEDQGFALKKIDQFLASGDKFFTLGGYAGTGKTTILKEIQCDKIAVAPTGKAAEVLRKSFPDAKTVHSYIYLVKGQDENGDPIFEKKWGEFRGLLIVDESSMVDEKMFNDIISTHKGKVIFVGDHGQLPPVRGKFNLMSNPDVRLEKIHRQGEDNPLIRLATDARLGRRLSASDFDGDSGFTVNDKNMFCKFYKSGIDDGFEDVQIITASNLRRCAINKKCRDDMGFHGKPQQGEKIIFLQNAKHVFNGTIAFIDNYSDSHMNISGLDNSISVEDYAILNPKPDMIFNGGVAFDFAYAITCHKSQGSSFPHVLIDYERKQSNQWLYTAITRAKFSVHIFAK
jgi:exodeoxyribonuclease V